MDVPRGLSSRHLEKVFYDHVKQLPLAGLANRLSLKHSNTSSLDLNLGYTIKTGSLEERHSEVL